MEILYYIKQNSFAFGISLFYVALGGLVACSLYPNDPLNGDWWFWGWLVTLPVNIISSAYRFTIGKNYFPVLIIQIIIIFIPTFILISKIIAKKSKKG